MPATVDEGHEVLEEEKPIDNATLERLMIKREARTRQMEARER
jgi:hypothetical protein